MPSKTVAELQAEAERQVAAIDDGTTVPADRAALVQALSADLGAADDLALTANDRLLKIDEQVQRLSAAITAITEATATIARLSSWPKPSLFPG